MVYKPHAAHTAEVSLGHLCPTFKSRTPVSAESRPTNPGNLMGSWKNLRFPKRLMEHAERKRRKLMGMKRESGKKKEGIKTEQEKAL